MNQENETGHKRPDSEILFSRVVKAGKRVYYLDVKRDRRDEYYVSLTESKRIKDATEDEKPVFEKHKIFLYREDFRNFSQALADVIAFVEDDDPEENAPQQDFKLDIEF